MSKSDIDSNSRIELNDPPELILKKLRKAVTDSTSHVTYDTVMRPGVSTLIDIDAACTGRDPDEIVEDCMLRVINTGEYKREMAQALIEHLRPIQKRYAELIDDKVYLSKLLEDGAEKANEIAANTYAEVTQLIGMN